MEARQALDSAASEAGSSARASESRSLVSTLALLALFGLLIAAAAPLAWYRLFSAFEWYDDEGYLMLSIASFDRGFALYDQVFSQYGPFYYLVGWLTHQVAGVPLDHAHVRWIVVALWLACSALCASFVLATCRNRALAAIAFAATFLHLGAIANEPGHPQGLALLLVCAWLALAPRVSTRPSALSVGMLGILCAALATTKVNLGLFACVSAVLALSSFTEERALRRWVRPLAWLAALALPVALTRAHWGEEWAQTYAAIVAISVVTTALALRARPSSTPFTLRHAASFAVALVLALGVFLGFALARGTSWRGLVHGVVGQHLQFASQFSLPAGLHYRSLAWSAGSLVLCLAVCAMQSGGVRFARAGGVLVALAKLAFGVLVLVLSYAANVEGLLCCAGPFLWLALVRVDPLARGLGAASKVQPGRGMLALVAMLQMLQAYPVAGSQMSWATLLLLPAAALCLGDALAFLAPTSWAHSWPRAAALRATLACVVALGLAALLAVHASSARERYRAQLPLRLPGTDGIRLTEREVATYGWLTRNVAAADAMYALPGLNSLYLWAQKEPPSLLNTTSWHEVFTPEMQRSVIDSLERHAHVEAIEVYDEPPIVPTPAGDGLPLVDYLRGFQRAGRVGAYELRISKGWTPEPISCALLRDDEALVFVPALPERTAMVVRIVDLTPRRRLASTTPIENESAISVLDEQRMAVLPVTPASGIDLSQPRRLVLRPLDRALRAQIARAQFPAVRLLDERGVTIVTLPFAR